MNKKNFISLCIAEFIGTFFLVFMGCGSVILNELYEDSLPPLAIPIVFGGVVSVMIYAVGHISGAHFNPAVTLAFSLVRKFPLNRLPGYIGSQFLGGLLASLLHLFIWGSNHSFGVTTLNVDLFPGIVMEVILSFLLMFVIMSVATDTRAVGELAGLAIGTTVTICAFIGGPLTGASMNPARSLGPALVSAQFINLWFYLLIPILGAVLGAKTYEFIRCHTDKPSDHGCC